MILARQSKLICLLALAITLSAPMAFFGGNRTVRAEPNTIRVWRTQLQRVDVVNFQDYLRVVVSLNRVDV